MRFAWIRKQTPGSTSAVQRFLHPATLVRFAHNLAFWLFLLPLLTPVSYRVGFLLFTGVIAVRAAANIYHNNLMAQTPEAFDRAWLRIPL